MKNRFIIGLENLYAQVCVCVWVCVWVTWSEHSLPFILIVFNKLPYAYIIKQQKISHMEHYAPWDEAVCVVIVIENSPEWYICLTALFHIHILFIFIKLKRGHRIFITSLSLARSLAGSCVCRSVCCSCYRLVCCCQLPLSISLLLNQINAVWSGKHILWCQWKFCGTILLTLSAML